MIVTATLNPAVDRVLEVAGFQIGAHARAIVKALLPAGKGNNVARGVARLGGAAAASGFVGQNEERMFAESLGSEGVETRFCTVAGLTRTNTTVLDPEAHTTTHLREQGFRVTAHDVRALAGLLADRLGELGDATLVFAGSLPPGMEPGHFAELIESCAARCASVVVDTNGPALRAAVETRSVGVLKPNLAELGELFGGPVAREEAAAAAAGLLDRVRTVLLTLGAEGALLVEPGGAVRCRCLVEPSDVRNTVGCGDAFLAGWLRGAEVSDDRTDALRWAVATGAASAMSEATVGYTLSEVEALLPRCETSGA